MGEFRTEELLDEFALRSAALIANPKSVEARAALKLCHLTWRAWKARRRNKALPDLAAEADEAARNAPGWRADIDG